jgi:hypothetical protein
MIDTIEHNAPLGNSDHQTLEFNFRFGVEQKKHYQNKLCWFKGNYEKINAQLNKIDEIKHVATDKCLLPFLGIWLSDD